MLCCATAAGGQAADGYVLLRDRVVVSSAADWLEWQAPPGARVVDADGTVRARVLRLDIDAMADAREFWYRADRDTVVGGLRAAGSGIEGRLPGGGFVGPANLAFDGDPTTFWEPERGQPLRSWHIEADLGRAVVAHRVTVHFAPAGLADPFLKFRVLLADGANLLTGLERPIYFRVGQVTRPNKEERTFRFDVQPRRRIQEGLTGEVVQFLRVEALATDGPRGAEVTAAQYTALDSSQRGAIDFFRRTAAGRQIRVSEAVWAALPDSERGDLRYHRWERPGLAEVEVEAEGDNATRLTQPVRKRPGEVGFTFSTSPLEFTAQVLSDGLLSTSFPMRTYNDVRDENQVRLDLGSQYWIERLRLISTQEAPLAYQLRTSTGEVDPAGRLRWDPFEPRQNPDGFLQVEERFAPRRARYIEVRRLPFLGGTRSAGIVSELHAFGAGALAELVLTSPILDLQRPRLMSAVTWGGQAPPGSRVEVRTRTGDDLLHVTHYFSPAGNEISQSSWNRLEEQDRGAVLVEDLPAPGWSDWSEPVAAPGAPFPSPSPRRYAMAQVRLLSDEPERAAHIRDLELTFAPPLVESALAEMTPVRDVAPGTTVQFRLFLQPRFAPDNDGFDRIRLRSASTAPIEVQSLRAGTEAQLRLGVGQRLWPGAARLEGEPGGGAVLDLPQPVVYSQQTGSGALLYEVVFRTQVFLSSTLFTAELARASQPGREQQASDGDATRLADTQSLVVVADVTGADLLDQLVVAPDPFTPNGDGVHDETAVEVAVFALEKGKQLEAGVFDLAGQRRRDLTVRSQRASGRYRLPWDGRDDAGRLVPPGIYFVRLQIDTEDGEPAVATATVHVVY